MSFKAAFAASLPEGRLHFAAHSHHPWPDATRAAQIAWWDDSARLLDAKWDHVFGAVIPAAQAHVARALALPDPATIAFGPNTHSFLMRILSCLPSPVRVLTTDAEFLSFSRQIARLEEDGLAQVTRIPAEPFASFAQRFGDAAAAGGHDLVLLSQVFYNSGFVVPGLDALVAAVRDPATFVVVDGYHGFMAVPTDLSAIAGRAFYTSGGYKYAMAGEGACFLHCPPGYGLRPRDTGWYAGFGALARADGGVPYAADGSRFLGATFDPSGLYRLNAVFGWLAETGLTVEVQRGYAAGLAAQLEITMGPLRDSLMLSAADPQRGRFLTVRTTEAARLQAGLGAQGIVTDHRGDRLRIGFGVYQSAADVQRLSAALRALSSPS